MRIAVCDDEQSIRELIAEKIKKTYPGADIALFRDGEELLKAVEEPKEDSHNLQEGFDIVILDIQMPGPDGMEIARLLRARDKELVIIFVTAVREYVFGAFDVGAFHYLVKPFSDEKFAQILQKAAAQVEQRGQRSRGETEVTEPTQPRFLMVKSAGKNIKVLIHEIEYAEVLNRKVTLHLISNASETHIVYYGKISELEALVGDGFYRVHRAYLVNLKYVRSYDAGEVRLETGSCIMAKAKYKDFVKAFLRYVVREEASG